MLKKLGELTMPKGYDFDERIDVLINTKKGVVPYTLYRGLAIEELEKAGFTIVETANHSESIDYIIAGADDDDG